ncbi:MAG: exodeoxyribonuclease VII small subunit [Nocardioidaceae bacterium]|nr:exodeoxyribonuclease VII small subunit [Nocardioidaceae bacterium]
MSDTPSYEQARDELITIVAKLEAGNSTLAESIELWERGEALAKIAQRHLDGARARLDAVVDVGDGRPDQD